MSGIPISSHDPVTDYATKVVSGEILAGKYVRLACERHLSDLKRDDLVWDLKAAQHHLKFFPHVLRLAFREEPYVRPFKLLPHQEFVQGCLFGWRKKNPDGSVGYRRFQYAFLEIAKGSGKSPEAAGTAIYMAMADGEPQAECYFASGDKDQAMIAFQAAVSMREISPELEKRLAKSGIKPCWQLTYTYPQRDSERRFLGSFLKPISSDSTQSGPRPHFVCFDELHEITKTAVVDMMRKATGKNRAQPLIYEITNSGVDRTSICFQHRDQAIKMLEGSLPNDSLFAFICGLDEGDGIAAHCICGKSSTWDRRITCPCCGDLPSEIDGSPQDSMTYLLAHPEIWEKANPGLPYGVPDYGYIRQQINDAIGLPSQRNLVLRLHFCVWTDSVTIWIPDEIWMSGADSSLAEMVDHPVHGSITKLERDLLGKRCYGGIDLARSNDWSALFLIFPDEESAPDPNDQMFDLLEWYWIDEETYKERAKNYKLMEEWRRQNFFSVYPGAVFNPARIQEHILEKISNRYVIDGIAYDRTFAHQVVTNLSEAGLTMVEWPQTAWFMGAAVSEVARRSRAKLYRHRGHPVTRWQLQNVALETDAGGLSRIDRRRSKDKVDGPQSLGMGHAWMMRAYTGKKKESVYETRGPIVIDDVYF